MFTTTVDKYYKSNHNHHLKMVVEILSTAQGLDRQVSLVLKKFGITHAQFNVLRILQGSKGTPLSAIQIKERLIFTGSDVSRMIDRLVKRELVSRETCPANRRKVDLQLTEKGASLLGEVLPSIDKSTDGFFRDVLSNEEVEGLLDSLNKIKSHKPN